MNDKYILFWMSFMQIIIVHSRITYVYDPLCSSNEILRKWCSRSNFIWRWYTFYLYLHITGSVIYQLMIQMTHFFCCCCCCCFFCSPASIVDCGDPPTLASGVTVETYNSTVVNSDIFFQCQQPDLVPSNRSATCRSDGRWSPDPSQVECRMITPVPTETPTLTGTPSSAVPTDAPVPTGIYKEWLS